MLDHRKKKQNNADLSGAAFGLLFLVQKNKTGGYMAEVCVLIFAILAFLFQVLVVFCCVIAGKRLDTEMGEHFLQKYAEQEEKKKQ